MRRDRDDQACWHIRERAVQVGEKLVQAASGGGRHPLGAGRGWPRDARMKVAMLLLALSCVGAVRPGYAVSSRFAVPGR